MPEIKQLFQLNSVPGVKRDGTELDGDNYTDGQWVRFQRGRPKRIGGYFQVTNRLPGPIRTMLVWSKNKLNNVYSFCHCGISMVQVDINGLGGNLIDRTPAGFTANEEILWSVDTLYDAAAGSEKTLVLALPADIMNTLDGTTERALCVGDVVGTGVFTAVADANAVASGGVFSAPPYAVLYGNDGKVTWSNANEPQNYTTGDAGTARVTGSKIVKGLSISSGSGPAGLLWSLDSVINMNFVGGAAIFRFTTVSRQSSIMSPSSVVEYDGTYFWVGNDRFLMTNGEQVSEVPNNMNFNWFFDHVNRDHSSKVWGMKIPRYGEIWWFYPRDDATECTHAIIFNVREKTWYDVELTRSAGYHQQVFNYPVMASSVKSVNRLLTITVDSGTISVGDTVTGGTSKATGYVMSVVSGTAVIAQLTSSVEFIDGEELTFGTCEESCYTFGEDLETSFVALNEETTWSEVYSGWYVDTNTENVYIESASTLCTLSGDMDIVVSVAIENPSGTGDLVVSVYDDEDNVLDTFGTGEGLPAGWPSATDFTVTIPSGTTGKIKILASVVGLMATYDKIVISAVELAP